MGIVDVIHFFRSGFFSINFFFFRGTLCVAPVDKMECTLCSAPIATSVTHVTSTTKAYPFHTQCFEKLARNIPTTKLRLTQLGVYDDPGRIVSVTLDASRHERCCVVDCTCTDLDFMQATCTSAKCAIGQVHTQCYLRKEAEWLAALKAQRTNRMNDDGLRKTMFTTKYDLIQPLCACICSNGYYRIDNRHNDADIRRRREVRVPKTPPKPPAVVKAKKTAAVARTNAESIRTPFSLVACGEPQLASQAASHPAEPSSPERPLRRLLHPAQVPSVSPPRVTTHHSPPSVQIPEDLVGLPPSDPNICPITRMRMLAPVLCVDGHWYDAEALVGWMQTHGRKSPISGAPLWGSGAAWKHAVRSR